ncbi:MAG: hypothetical protein IKE64_07815 [Thermoguttaceae bacterium]|nr:hypothetical protein [Thermoguttaceae bacterium]
MFCCCLLFFAAVGVLLVLFGLYYQQPQIEELVGQDLRPVDLGSEGSLFTWFLSILWLVVSGIGFVSALMTLSQRALKSCFWSVVALTGLVMSCVTACGLSPLISRMAQKGIVLVSGGALSEESSVFVFYGVLGAVGVIFALYAFRYVSFFSSITRKVLWLFFVCSFSLATVSIAFHWIIPTEEGTESSLAAAVDDRAADGSAAYGQGRLVPKSESGSSVDIGRSSGAAGGSSGTLSKPTVIGKPNGTDRGTNPTDPTGQKKGKDSEKGDFVSCAYSSDPNRQAEERPCVRSWSDLFGIDLSPFRKADESGSGDAETAEPKECFLSALNLDLVRTRELCRRGTYALFVVFFSTALLVLARAERIYTEYKQYTIKKMRIIQQIEKENPYEKKNRETASYYDNQFDYSQFGDFNSMDFPMR